MECGRRVPRGQPVIALATVLAMWIGVRATLIALEGDPAAQAQAMARLSTPPASTVLMPRPMELAQADRPRASLAPLTMSHVLRTGTGAARQRGSTGPLAGLIGKGPSRLESIAPDLAGDASVSLADGFGAAFDTWQALGLGLPGPRLAYLASPQRETAASPEDLSPRGDGPRLRRWSADGWLLLRGGDQAPGLVAGAASYGGSQAGAILRYGFAPASALHPQAYVRVSGAVSSRLRQNEGALGLMVRPLRRLPIALLGEVRVLTQPGLTRTRPVVMAVTQLPPLRLPLRIEAEAYAQGGWAGGRDATGFYDLSATFQRRVARPLPGVQINAGGGVWSGGQRSITRLDVGPRIEMRGMVGPPSRRIGVRVGVDWRFRVAGAARPGSGPALTVAAGF